MKLNFKLLTGLYALFGIVFIAAEYHRIGDFNIFLLASEALQEGKNIYTTTYVSGFHYYYSPFFAILMQPLAALSHNMAAALWNALSFVLLGRLLYLLFTMYFSKHPKAALIVLLGFLGCLFPIYSNFHMTQMSVLMLYSIFECLYQAQYKNRPFVGGILLGFTLSVKVIPIVLIPYLLYRCHFKTVAYAVLGVLVFLTLPVLFIGYENTVELTSSWFDLLNPTQKDHLLDNRERGFHSLTTLFTTLFTSASYEEAFGVARNVADWNAKSITLLINLARAALLLITFTFLRTFPFKKATDSSHSFSEIAYICLITPLVFPHQQAYGFFFVLPATMYLAWYFVQHWHDRQSRYFKIVLTVCIIAVVIVNLELIYGEYRKWYWYFKTLTYGTSVLLVALALSRPKVSSKDNF